MSMKKNRLQKLCSVVSGQQPLFLDDIRSALQQFSVPNLEIMNLIPFTKGRTRPKSRLMEPTRNQLNKEWDEKHFTVPENASGGRPRLENDDLLRNREQLSPRHRYWECEDDRLRAVLRAVRDQEEPDELFEPKKNRTIFFFFYTQVMDIVSVACQGGQGEPSMPHSGGSPHHNISEDDVVMDDIIPGVSRTRGTTVDAI